MSRVYNLYPGVKKLWSHISHSRRRSFLKLCLLAILVSLSEILSIGSLFPFLAIVLSPQSMISLELFGYFEIINIFLSISTVNYMLEATLIFCMATIIAGFLRLLLIWNTAGLATLVGSDVSTKIFWNTINKPFLEHVNSHTSDVISAISMKVNNVIYNVLLPLMSLVSSLILSLIIFIALLFFNAPAILAITLIIGLIYVVMSFSVRSTLKINSERISIDSKYLIKVLQESLSGIRDVIIGNTQLHIVKIYSTADRSLRVAEWRNVFLVSCPRYILESLGIVIIALLAYILSYASKYPEAVIPTLGALALGLQRMLPLLQQIYGSYASIQGQNNSLNDINEMLERTQCEVGVSGFSSLSFATTFEIKNGAFTFDGLMSPTINSCNLLVNRGDIVGIVGESGSGKSTLLDIIMGLIPLGRGFIQVDGNALDNLSLKMWQKGIAHVPQNIFLSDSSIEENIAFGIPSDGINQSRIEHVIKIAQLENFINTLPNGKKSIVGERGMKISGGERQRIGIARALYKDANVLVLDEATSALDSATEENLINAIHSEQGKYTIIMVAHRISTLKQCTKIYRLSSGSLQCVSYDQLKVL